MSRVSPAVDVRDLRAGYPGGPDVLANVHLRVDAGARIFLYGPSGSGKTTLLSVLAGVLPARSGQVEVLGTDLSGLTPAARDRFRGAEIGYIFQQFNLIPYLSVRENIVLPCRLNPARRARLGDAASPADAAAALAEALDIGELLDRPVTALSVGQQQRVAAARALIGRPALVIADEPTSSLDADRRARFLELLFARCAEHESALLFVSHDRALADHFDRALDLASLAGASTEAA
ncbi:MAG: ATP-binding cassette domain-containing protein [Acidobacteriota bacterium]